jgi:predicted enzyme related to lactoylglutathione lyase
MPHIESNAPGSFGWIELATTDQNDAKRFYGSLFGWSANDSPMGPGEYYTMFQLQDRNAAAAYQLKPERDGNFPPHWNLYVAVDDADATARLAAELGGNVIESPFDVFTYGRMAVITDPTGAVFCIWQAKAHSGIGISGERGTMCWADLSSPDPERAAAFYSRLFGWKIAPGEHDNSGYLHIQNGSDYIGGVPPVAHRDPNTPPHWLVYFTVEDVDVSTATLKGAGGTTLKDPSTIENVGRMSIVKDPQGAVFALFRETTLRRGEPG